MPTMFPQTLGAPDPAQAYAPTGYAVPPEMQAQLDAINKRRQQAPQPLYTPEQVQQRRDENERQYALGMLGQMSSDEGLQNVGGQVFKQALANRQAKISERGTTDPLSGQFTYSPDYLAQRDDTAEAGVNAKIGAQRQAWDLARAAAGDRREQQKQRAEDQRDMRMLIGSNRPEKLIAVMGPDGVTPMLVPQSQAAGMRPVSASGGGQPNDGERNAAGFAARMQHATGILDEQEARGRGTAATNLAGHIPLVGGMAQGLAMTKQQQLYNQAQNDWVRAKLRKESGATIGDKEMADEITTYFPQPNDGPDVREQKRQARAIATASMTANAGRAAIVNADLSRPGEAPSSVDVGAALGRPGAAPRALPKSNPQGGNRQIKAMW